MDYDYQEAMKLANQLCFPLYAAARHVRRTSSAFRSMPRRGT